MVIGGDLDHADHGVLNQCDKLVSHMNSTFHDGQVDGGDLDHGDHGDLNHGDLNHGDQLCVSGLTWTPPSMMVRLMVVTSPRVSLGSAFNLASSESRNPKNLNIKQIQN